MAMQSSSSSFTYRFTYDVFLSFRGKDTRYGFTGHLYKVLRDRGIHTFIDDQELQRGDEITPALEKAIQESRIFIVVLSENYATSSFCLNELAYILNFTKDEGHLVLPLFLKVDPSDVRHHTGSFGNALADHENKRNASLEKLETWKMALNQVANLSGYHFNGETYEHEFIEDKVKLVSRKINRAPLYVADYPVGLESQVLLVKALLDVGSDNVIHMVGIHGPGGIGKTTLATAVYNSVADHFEAFCFLENVRETSNKHGLTYLQSNLLSETVGGKKIKLTSLKQGISIIPQRLQRKKILLILDDVDKEEQLQAIVGRSGWFGFGSRVIITTRNKQLLACHGVERTYEVKELNKKDALELLCWKAFKLGESCPRYQDVLNQAVTYASGYPLALEVIGSNLFEKSIEQWESTLNRYKRIPNKKIHEVLKVSYDDLEEDEQSVFLDISCCFKNYKLSKVEDILRAHYGHCMKHHIDVLVQKSLMKISWNSEVTLHDLIEDMGKEFVRKESPKEPAERSRLWFHEDIFEVLEENKGTCQIKIIHMDFSLSKEVEWDGDAFKKMKNLKTLIIRNGKFSKGPKHLPNSLRVLEWRRYPSRDFPNDFHPKRLAICMLPNSDFTSLELSTLLLKKKFVNLTSLNFDWCQCLTHIPDVSGVQQLEKLSFESCHNLLTIHDSVGFLEKLKILNARDCGKLRSFPPIKLTSLEQLQLTFCGSLESFPEILGKMKNITRLGLQGTPIKKFPLSFQNLTGLEELDLGHRGLVRLRGQETCMFILNISMMPQLAVITAFRMPGWEWPNDSFVTITCSNIKRLSLRCCNLPDEFFPIGLPWFANVEELDLSFNDFTVIPECFKECRYLTNLSLNYCVSLREIRGIPLNLKYFCAEGCVSLSSSCRSMLLSQELHEAGYTNFRLPRANIPEWFEYRSRGLPISFRFRNKFPAIAICSVMASADDCSLLEYEDENEEEYLYKLEDGLVYSMPKAKFQDVKKGNLILTVNGKEHKCYTLLIEADNTYLFDLREIIRNEDKLDEEALLENDWNHVKVMYINDAGRRILIKSGTYVLKEQSMEDIQWVLPWTDDDLSSSDEESENIEVAQAKSLCWRYPLEDFSFDIDDVICQIPNKSRFMLFELAGFLLKKKFVNLTNLYFDKCQSLIEIPDLSCLQQLENLSFRFCHNLLTIHDSVGFLGKLKILNAKCCCNLKSFPPITMSTLEQLNLASCDSLESFPEILGNMKNMTKLNLDETPINLNRLQQLYQRCNVEDTSSCRDAAIFLWSICMMLKVDKSIERVSSTVSSGIQNLSLRKCNLTDEFFSIASQFFANVKELDLSENNFRVIPESIKEFPFLTKLILERCECLEEIRGIPPNLKYFSAKECLSLTSSSRSMLCNQEFHEVGNTDFYLPGDNIPEWFECQTQGPRLSFRFRNNFPAIAICLVMEDEDKNEEEDEDQFVRLMLVVNGYRHYFFSLSMGTGTRLFGSKDLKKYFDGELFENEWNHVEIIFEDINSNPISMKSGMHVLKQIIWRINSSTPGGHEKAEIISGHESC